MSIPFSVDGEQQMRFAPVLLLGLFPAVHAAALGNKEPLTAQQAWRQENGTTITVRFEVRKDFAVSDDGEVWLLNLMSSDRLEDAEQFNIRVIVTDRCRKEFSRIGVAKLAAHFAGRVVTVRGKVSRVTHNRGPDTGGMAGNRTSLTIVSLTIDSLDQFVSVR
jgi:hypothetical protein